ncbi:MAG: MFS transporter [Longimicrobiales bacterium]
MTSDPSTGDVASAAVREDAAPPKHRQYGRRSVIGWATYDFANSAYTTLIVTFIYSYFFARTIAADGTQGTILWSRAVTITALIVAVLSPLMGALADRSGYRRRFMVITTAISVIGAALLWFPRPGDVILALTIFVIGDIAYEMTGTFYNSYLPDVAPPEKIGRISGYGWALGYLGGLLAMVVALFGLIQPEQPWFGLSKDDFANVRATGPLVAIWFALFSIPFFLWVKDRRPAKTTAARMVIADAARQLGNTFREIRRYRQIFRLLVARLFYNDGLTTIFSFGSIYAGVTFGFSLTEVTYFGLALNVMAGLGALLMGFMDDRIGGKKTILITIVGLTIGSLAAVLAQTKLHLWLAGLFLGIFVGPNQAASRSLLGRFVPHEKETEFYGFFAFSGKAIAFMGPFLLGVFTDAFETQRAGIATILFFFLVGGLLLLAVDEREGVALAR